MGSVRLPQMVIAFFLILSLLSSFLKRIFLKVFFGCVSSSRSEKFWQDGGQKGVPVVGVVVVGCAVLPGDGGHGSLPGDCLLFHVCCVSYLEHCIIQLDGEKSKFSYSHFGYPFTLYVLLYKITVPAQYIFDRENVRYIVRNRIPTTVRCDLVHCVLLRYGWVLFGFSSLNCA